jgi:signal peptidase II
MTGWRNRILLFGLFIGMVAVDQWVKQWVRGAIPINGSVGGKPWPGIFEITLTYNQGIAFGMLKGSGLLMTPIAVIMAGAAIWYSLKSSHEGPLVHTAMGLVAAGAIGNMIDRIWLGHVTDMFWFRLIDFPVFNVADACITIATILLIYAWGIAGNRSKPAASPEGTA